MLNAEVPPRVRRRGQDQLHSSIRRVALPGFARFEFELEEFRNNNSSNLRSRLGSSSSPPRGPSLQQQLLLLLTRMEPSVVDPYRPFQLVGPSARSSPRPGGGAGSKRTKGVAPTQGPTPEVRSLLSGGSQRALLTISHLSPLQPTSTSSNGSTSSSYSALAPSSFYAPCPKPDPSTLSAKALGKRAATSVPDLGSARGRKDGPSEAGASKLGGRKLKRRRTEEVAHQVLLSKLYLTPTR